MRNNLLSFFAQVAGLLICFAVTAGAQQEGREQTSVTFKSGVTVAFTSETDPPGRQKMTPGSVQVRDGVNVVHRIFLDRENRLYFGYDLGVEAAEGSDQYRLTIRPLSEPPTSWVPSARRPRTGEGYGQARADSLRLTDLTSLALPEYPPPQTVHGGDTLALDVLVNPRTSVKIIDLIKISSAVAPPHAWSQSGDTSPAAAQGAVDLTPEIIQLRVTDSRLLVNGLPAFGAGEGTGPGGAGSLLWFYLPGYGRFILSLTPREGYDFRKAGVVEGRGLSFTAGGNRFELISASLVVPSVPSPLSLWVLHDTEYKPDAGHRPFEMGAESDVKNLLTKH